MCLQCLQCDLCYQFEKRNVILVFIFRHMMYVVHLVPDHI